MLGVKKKQELNLLWSPLSSSTAHCAGLSHYLPCAHLSSWPINPVHPSIWMHILHTAPYTFPVVPVVLTKIICLMLKILFCCLSFPLSLWRNSLTQEWYCIEKLEASYSLELKGYLKKTLQEAIGKMCLFFVTGMLSAWDTRQNKCFIHWEGDSAEIGMQV